MPHKTQYKMKTIQEIKDMLSRSEGLGNVRMALNSYLESMELDPDGPAAEAYRHIQELLDFYNKDYYNP